MNELHATASKVGMLGRSAFISIIMIVAAFSVARIDTVPDAKLVTPRLDEMLPDSFGEWKQIELNAAVLPAEAELGPGEATAYRAYRDRAGRSVTLVVAYGPPLGDSVRLHRPESCYVAQGFAIHERTVGELQVTGAKTKIVRLDTENSLRQEAVTYWLRDGDKYVVGAQSHELLDLRRGLGHEAEGVLVRVSSRGEGENAFSLHERFLKDFTGALSADARELLLVGPSSSGPQT